jgi:hypothetical protein
MTAYITTSIECGFCESEDYTEKFAHVKNLLLKNMLPGTFTVF